MDDFINADEAAKILRVSKKQLAHARMRADGCRFYKPSRRVVLYKRSEVLDFIEKSARMGTHEAAQ